MGIKPEVTEQQLETLRHILPEHLGLAAPEHGMGHALEVERLALDCLPENGDPNTCSAIALLHDCDDWKMFPSPDGEPGNAMRIMRRSGIAERTVQYISTDLKKFGFSKRLKGLAPETPEGRAASDADMLTLMGASGIVRLGLYNGAKGIPFFDPDDWPDEDMTFESYTAKVGVSAVRHIFDKVLRLPGLMLTDNGRIEAHAREGIMVCFLRQLFEETDHGDWSHYLLRYLERM